MEKYISFVVLGVVLIVLGILNCMGNISFVHRYNRKNVSEADVPKYGKCVGIGTIICGVALLVTVIFELVLQIPIGEIGLIVGFVLGFAPILFAQFKYNKGFF